MANTYTQLNVHVVFAVKGRENVLNEKFTIRLFEYLSGTLVKLQQYPFAVGGHKNHVHIFFELNPASSLVEMIAVIDISAT